MVEPRVLRYLIVGFIATTLSAFVAGFLISQRVSGRQQVDPVYAKVNGVAIHEHEVVPEIQSQIVEHEKAIYRLKRNATENFILSKTKGVSDPAETLANEGPVDEAVLQSWANERGIRLGSLTAKQHEDLVANYRIQQKALRANSDRQRALNATAVEWLLPLDYRNVAVKTDVGSLSIFKSGTSKDTVILFANFHCGSCAKLNLKMRELEQQAGRDLSISMRFNVQAGDGSIVSKTARAAICAAEQNKFSEFFEAAFGNPPADNGDLEGIARKLNFDTAKFESCLDLPKTVSKLLADATEFERISKSAMPVAVVNGRLMPLQEPVEEYLFLLGK